MVSPVTVEFKRTTRASVADTWALLADTDRFNRTVDFGFSFEEHPQADGSVHRTGTARILGMQMSWQELPFSYRKPAWFVSRRLFLGGPARELRSSVHLSSSGLETEVRYLVQVFPRSMLLWPAVAVELRSRNAPRIEKVLDAILEHLGGGMAPDPAPPTLSARESTALIEIGRSLESPEFAAHLKDFIRRAPLQEQARMNPLRAGLWGADSEGTIRGFLDAVRKGALCLTWELLCPLCWGPKLALERSGPRQVHCSSCNIRYDGTFPTQVAVNFRPAPQVRDFDLPLQCIGSPERQPHVLAQDLLAPGAEVDVELTLQSGAFRLRTLPMRAPLPLTIRDGRLSRESVVFVGHDALTTQSGLGLTLAPGQVRIRVKNTTDRPVTMMLERRGLPADVLTAGRFFELPGAVELLPEELVAPDFSVRAHVPSGLLALERHPADAGAVTELAAKLLQLESARLVAKRDGGLVATFTRFDDALAALTQLVPSKGWSAGLGWGPVHEVGGFGEARPMGTAIEQTIAAAMAARPGFPCVPCSMLDHDTLRAGLRHAGWAPSVVGSEVVELVR